MLNDVHAPIENEKQDILDRSLLAGRIYDRLRGESCPQAIGIYGGWGTGKTSLLNLLSQLNKKKIMALHQEDLHIEIIDAWKYEGVDSLLIPVIVRMKGLLGDADLPDAWHTITRRVLATATISVFDAVLKKFTDIDRKDIKETYEEVKAQDNKRDYSNTLLEWESWSDEIEGTEKAFSEIIQTICERKKFKRIVLCIDNLDRCSPDRAVNLLESIKNFFSVSGCVWLFVMDSDVIASYIRHKYEDTAMNGYSFLDKIIPEQYHLSFYPDESDPRIYNLIRTITGSDLTLNDWKRLPLLPNVMVPRRLKKSAVKFSECFSGMNPADADLDTVFLLSLLYHTWPDFYERLSSNLVTHVGGILANFFKNCKTEEMGWQWGDYSPLPLDKKFVDEQDLIQFLHTAFPDAKRSPENVTVSIQRAMTALRRVGLP